MHPQLKPVLDSISNVLLGKEEQVKLALTCLLARGHLLIEDLPGMGKTTLSHALANVMGLEYQRIQFTSDLLPADILGNTIYQPSSAGSAQGTFIFHKGPVFSQVVLADEINRATPKSQSALLEAMEERQVSMDGTTYALPNPFFVIATQNPVSQAGTFTLPESQLDRFLVKIELGYPHPQAERLLLEGKNTSHGQVAPVLNESQLQKHQDAVVEVLASDALLDYVQRLIQATREQVGVPFGLSPRGGLALLNAAKGWAYLHGRNHVLPDDVQSVFLPVVEHRLLTSGGRYDRALCQTIMDEVAVV